MSRSVPAKYIPLKDYRQTLTWPFVMSAESGTSSKDWFDKCRARLEHSDSQWAVCDPSRLMPDAEKTGLYEEAVYFHDFIRAILYKKRDDIATYQQPDLVGMDVTLKTDEGPVTYCFKVLFNALHIYKTGAAILTLELQHTGDPLTLDQAQTLTDCLRRAYPPFWIDEGKPGLSPTNVTLHHRHPNAPSCTVATECPLTRLHNRETALKSLNDNDFNEPIFSWWRRLLAPLHVNGNPLCDERPPLLRQVLDERIPVMTTMALREGLRTGAAISSISDGDWFRIALADSAGSGQYPYHPAFLDKQRNTYFYDRFMAFDGMDSSAPSATRFAFAGYHFAAVGEGWFFDDFVTEHVRRHYRHMQHLCLLEFATLLSISQKLCAARDSRTDEDAGDSRFREEVLDIQKSFLDFTHRYHFTGVSNQLQARELFDRFRDSMQLDQRYAEIRAELSAATELALAEEQREATQATTHLAEIGTVAAVLGVAAGLTGMNVIFDEEAELFALLRLPAEKCAGLVFDFGVFGVVLFLVVSGAIGLFGQLSELKKRDGEGRSIGESLQKIRWLAVIIAIGGLHFGWAFPADCPPATVEKGAFETPTFAAQDAPSAP